MKKKGARDPKMVALGAATIRRHNKEPKKIELSNQRARRKRAGGRKGRKEAGVEELLEQFVRYFTTKMGKSGATRAQQIKNMAGT